MEKIKIKSPIKNFKITSKFGPRNFKNEKGEIVRQMHNGIDLISITNDKNIYCPVAGICTLAYKDYDEKQKYLQKNTGGIYCVIKSEIAGNVFYFRFLHLEKLLIEKNQKLKEGEIIGIYGNTGLSRGEHLHFEMYDANWNVLNPENFII